MQSKILLTIHDIIFTILTMYFFCYFSLGLNGTLAMKFMDWTTQSSGGIGLLDYIKISRTLDTKETGPLVVLEPLEL